MEVENSEFMVAAAQPEESTNITTEVRGFLMQVVIDGFANPIPESPCGQMRNNGAGICGP